jgi:hypothetical protein
LKVAFFQDVEADEIPYRLKVMYRRAGDWVALENDVDVNEALNRGERSAENPSCVTLKAILRPGVDVRRIRIQTVVYYRDLADMERIRAGTPFLLTDLPDVTMVSLGVYVYRLIADTLPGPVDRMPTSMPTSSVRLRFYERLLDEANDRTYNRVATVSDLLDRMHNLINQDWNLFVEVEDLWWAEIDSLADGGTMVWPTDDY